MSSSTIATLAKSLSDDFLAPGDFSAIPIGETRVHEYLSRRSAHKPNTWLELQTKLSASCWQPLKIIVPNFEYVKTHQTELGPSQLYRLIQDPTMTCLSGTVWYILRAEDVPQSS